MSLTVQNCPGTPWGKAQTVTELAIGIWQVETASHGGFYVSSERFAAMPAELRQTRFSGNRWFEEDCDWALVVVAFPDDFKPEMVTAARESIGYWHPDLAAKYGEAA